MIHFDCPNCGARMDIDSGFRGAVARCEKCGALIQVPSKSKPTPQRIVRPKSPTPPEKQAAAGQVVAPSENRGRGRSRLIWILIVIVLLALGAGYAWWHVYGFGRFGGPAGTGGSGDSVDSGGSGGAGP